MVDIERNSFQRPPLRQHGGSTPRSVDVQLASKWNEPSLQVEATLSLDLRRGLVGMVEFNRVDGRLGLLSGERPHLCRTTFCVVARQRGPQHLLPL